MFDGVNHISVSPQMALEADMSFSGSLRHVKTTLNKMKFLRFQAGTQEQQFPKWTTKFAAVIKFVTRDISGYKLLISKLILTILCDFQ